MCYTALLTVSSVDAKDLDVLLAEITILNTRTELYLRFLRRRILVSYTFYYLYSQADLQQIFTGIASVYTFRLILVFFKKLQDRIPSKGLRERLGLDDIISVLQQNKL